MKRDGRASWGNCQGLPSACSLAARDGIQDCALALRGELGLQKRAQARPERSLSALSLTPPPGFSISRGQGQALPIPLPTWTHYWHGSGAMAPAFTAPLPPEVLVSSMQEEVASEKSCQSVLDLFRLPGLHWRTYNLLVVKYAVLCTPPSDRAGWGWYSGGKQLLQPHGVHSWLGQAAPPGGRSLTGRGDSRGSTYRCGQEDGLCRKSAREQGWDMVLGRGPGQTEAQGRGRALMSPEPRDQQELESQHHTYPKSWTPGVWKRPCSCHTQPPLSHPVRLVHLYPTLQMGKRGQERKDTCPR